MAKNFIFSGLAVLALCLLATAQAAQTYQRGEYAFAVGAAPDWVQPQTVAVAWDPAAPGASGERWRFWLLDFQANRRGGARERYYDIAYEAVSSELIGDAAKFQVDFLPAFERLTIHDVSVRRDGAWQNRFDPARVTLARRESSFERDMTTGAVTALLVLDDIRPGDVVRARYSIDGNNPILAGLDHERVSFAATSVILDRHMRVVFDPAAKVTVRRLNGAREPVEKRTREAHELALSVHGVAATHDEGAYPLWYWPVPELAVSETRTWADVAAWARTLYPPPKPLPPDLEERIAAWSKLDGIDDRIGSALRAVQEEVRYFGTEIGDSSHQPAEPADTWTRRYGDCKDKARLLATILDRLGVKAYPALVSASHGRGVADLPPSAAAFNHVIVRVDLPGEKIWLDATATQQRGPIRKYDRIDLGMALTVADDTRDLEKIPAPTAVDHVVGIERYTPAADGKVTLEVETRYIGSGAERLRRSVRTSGKDELDRRYADYYRKRYGEIDVSKSLDVLENDSENSITVSASYKLSNPWTNNTPSSRVMDSYADLVADRVRLPATMSRSAPMAIDHPTDIEQTVEIHLPSGWRWLGHGDTQTVDDNFAHYEKIARDSSNVVQIVHHYTSRQDVAEAREANTHLQRLRELNDDLNQRVSFSLAAPEAEKQRRQRLENALRNIMDNKDKSDHD